MRRLTGSLALGALLCASHALVASADGGITSDNSGVNATATDTSQKSPERESKVSSHPGGNGGATGRSSTSGVANEEPDEARRAEIKLQRQVADYKAALDRWRTCMTQTLQPIVSGNAAPFCPEPVPPDFATELPGTLATSAAAAVPGAPQIVLTPEQIAYIAFARLHLEPLKPVIGPPPELNRWNMAAVGYPLWLSGGGDPHPPAVWDQVFNLRVRLEARVKSVDFLMGDGNVVTCDGPGLRWTPAVKPGKNPRSADTSTPSLHYPTAITQSRPGRIGT